MRTILLIFLFLGLISAQETENKRIPVLNFDQLEPLLNIKNDSIYLINFWATWCVPCREELPAIEKIGEKYKDKRLKIILVSLDFPTQLGSRLIPFVKSSNIKSDIILLDDPDQNKWINKVDPEWSGAIPYTIIYGKKFKSKYYTSFSFHELDSIINLKINVL